MFTIDSYWCVSIHVDLSTDFLTTHGLSVRTDTVVQGDCAYHSNWLMMGNR
jgi:hypothetical protein